MRTQGTVFTHTDTRTHAYTQIQLCSSYSTQQNITDDVYNSDRSGNRPVKLNGIF